MTLTPWTVAKIVGAVLAGYLWVHYLGMPNGLIAAVATILLLVP